jgi:putative zinc finger protein/HEAT repeat protein
MTSQIPPQDSCARAEELLPDYWAAELSAIDRAWLQQHLQICADCSELAAMWRELGKLPEAEPNPLQRRRFDAILAACDAAAPQPASQPTHRESWRHFWHMWLRPAPLAVSLAIVFAAASVGWFVHGTSTTPNSSGVAGQSNEIAALREQVNDTRQLVVLSMLQQQSANDRLAGISYSSRVSPLDPQIMRALLHSLQDDPSPDVRLAALDALQRAGGGQGSSAAARSLVDAFAYQNSPLVQVALVDSFFELRPPGAQQLLQKVSDDRSYTPEVQQRAAWALSHWN